MVMASIKPLYPLSSPIKHTPSLTTPLISCKPTTEIPFPISLSSQFSRETSQFIVSVAFNPPGDFDIPLLEEEENAKKAPPSMPPKQDRYEVVIDNDAIRRLDLSPFCSATGITSPSSVQPKEFLERTIGFTINYVREDEYDLPELSEFPDIRLWFVRLDATYPWLPVLLDWRAGELARYAAMLVPHQMSMRMGVVFNPEALELFIMKKVFIVYNWLKQNDIPKPRLKTKDMAKMLGFGIGDELFNMIDENQSSSPYIHTTNQNQSKVLSTP